MSERVVALYARVSSEQQAQAQTIQSQVAALRERIAGEGGGCSAPNMNLSTPATAAQR